MTITIIVILLGILSLLLTIKWLVPNLGDYITAEKKTIQELVPEIDKALTNNDSAALVKIAVEFGAKSLVEALSEHSKVSLKDKDKTP